MPGASTLWRLFRYSRATDASPLENFTTEALAAAFRQDPGPLLQVLSRHSISVSVDAKDLGVRTQVPIGRKVALPSGLLRTGTIDLELDLPPGNSPRILWIEVKVKAELSDDQWRVYREVARGRGLALALLSKSPMELPAEHTGAADHEEYQIRWQELWNATVPAADPTPAWVELRTFLEENHVADSYDQPVHPAETEALAQGHTLYRKVRRTLRQTVAALPDLEGWRWPGEARVNQLVAGQFTNHGRMAVTVGSPRRSRLGFGVGPIDRSIDSSEAGPCALAWVDCALKQTELRLQLLDLATDPSHGLIAAGWHTNATGRWPLWIAGEVLADSADLQRWFTTRIQELRTAGILDLINTAGFVEADLADDEILDEAE